MPFLSLVVVLLMAGWAIGQSLVTEINNETSLIERNGFGPISILDDTADGVCSSILLAGGIKFGNNVWADQAVDQAMIQELTSFPISNGANFASIGWTGVFILERASVVPNQAVDCRRTDTFCTFRKTCAHYKGIPFLLAAISIENIHRSLSAQISAYDRVIAQLDAGNQAGIKALLKDPEFPNTRGFTFSAFLDGFILGVNLVSGIPKSLFSAILKAIKTGVKATCFDAGGLGIFPPA